MPTGACGSPQTGEAPISSRGITVIEIVGSLCVVGLVGAVAVPLLANGKESGLESTCLKNMKQIGASLTLYAEDYDRVLPRTTEERPKKGYGSHWTVLVQPYIRSQKIFVCPADPKPSYTFQDAYSRSKRVPLLSYINNYAVVPAHDFYSVPFSALTDPASLIAIGERRSQMPDGRQLKGWKGTGGFNLGQPCADQSLGTDYLATSPQEAQSALAENVDDKALLIVRLQWLAHGKGSNYTFADGHAAHQALERTLDRSRFEWGERFYPRSMPISNCDRRGDTLHP